MRRFIVPAALVMSLTTGARAQEPSAADVDSARAAFLQGIDMRDKRHDNAAAIERFKAAYALVPTPRIGFELGRTLRQTGDLVGAHAAFLAATQLPVKRQESAEAKKARTDSQAQAADLEQRVPRLLIRLTGTGQVYVDGEALRHEALTVPRHLNPGQHVLQVQVDGDVKQETRVDLAEGDRKEISMSASDTAQAPQVQAQAQVQINAQQSDQGATPPPPPPGGFSVPVYHRNNTAVKAAFWYTAAGLAGLGIVPGVFALSFVKSATDACTGNTCTSDFESNKNWAYGFAIATDVIWTAAIICAVVAIITPASSSDVAVTATAMPVPGGGVFGAVGRF